MTDMVDEPDDPGVKSVGPPGPSDDALSRWSKRASESIEPVVRWLREHQEQIAEALRAAGFQGLPPNWASLAPDKQQLLLKLLESEDGTPLAWLPPADVLSTMLSHSSPEGRDSVLLTFDAQIERSARKLLRAVTAAELAELRDAVGDAWDAYVAGHRRSAQALAAACITASVQGAAGLGLAKLAHLQRELEAVPQASFFRLWKLREAATLSALSVALRNDRHPAGQPGFNRHLTTHSVAVAQYTEANSLRSLILATAATRELQELRTGPLGPLVGPNRLRVSPPNGVRAT